MRVLVACEYSGRVRDAFTKRGHYALSCDLLSSESPGPHHQGDVRDVLDSSWDLLIGFPPCTHLSISGARWWKAKQADGRQQAAIDFARLLMEAPVEKIAIENPIGRLSTAIRKPGETKATCLWLKGLPLLTPTNVVEGREPRIHYMAPGPMRSKLRSLTYQGIADAMAKQWGAEQ